MRVAEWQMTVLIQTLRDSLSLSDGGRIFSYTKEDREALLADLLEQQDGVLEVGQELVDKIQDEGGSEK